MNPYTSSVPGDRLKNDQFLSQPGLSLVMSEVSLLSATAFVFFFLSDEMWSFFGALFGELVYILFWSGILLGLMVQCLVSPAVAPPFVVVWPHLLVPYVRLR